MCSFGGGGGRGSEVSGNGVLLIVSEQRISYVQCESRKMEVKIKQQIINYDYFLVSREWCQS